MVGSAEFGSVDSVPAASMAIAISSRFRFPDAQSSGMNILAPGRMTPAASYSGLRRRNSEMASVRFITALLFLKPSRNRLAGAKLAITAAKN